MYSFVYRIYFILNRLNKRNNYKQCLKSFIISKILARIEWYYNEIVVEYYKKDKKTNCFLNKKKRNKRVIASLTSYPKRINTVWITIETILRQSVKPDIVILWLARNQFDGLESLPNELLRLQKRGLSIKFCDDLRSHKKYYYALKEYPDDLIILFDDDMFYPKDTIKKLMHLHKKNPNDICTITTEVIEPDIYSVPSMWRNPNCYEKIEHSNRVQIFTGSGTLIEPHLLDEEVFNKDLIKKICPYADDLWITFMTYKKNTKITSLNKWRAFPVCIYNTGKGSLWYINSEEGQNDIQWKNLQEVFKDEFKEMKRNYDRKD